jgi:uncharacterized protein involved in type VI secretion and phage assembly
MGKYFKLLRKRENILRNKNNNWENNNNNNSWIKIANVVDSKQTGILQIPRIGKGIT